MAVSSLIRWSGLAAFLGAVLFVVGDLMHLLMDFRHMAAEAQTGFYAVHAAVLMFAALLVLLGLIGIYANEAEAAGTLGVIGFLIAFADTASFGGLFWAEFFFHPSLATTAPEFVNAAPPPGLLPTLLLATLGWVLFAVATLRAKVYPRWMALLLIVGSVFNGLPLPTTSVLWAAGIACLGFILVSGTDEAASTARA